jgi:hypothetical protein
MPGLDRTGPMGAGSMTGGRRGLCNPATAASGNAFTGGYGYGYGYGGGLGLRRGFRGGFGRGGGIRRGYGRGYGWYPGWYPPFAGPVYPFNPADEMNTLRAEADYLKKSLDAINARIDELEEKPAQES